ncbi:MAG: class I SAM-dependent methyltransferase [Candidatus Puniceispirillaceae bacterium]
MLRARNGIFGRCRPAYRQTQQQISINGSNMGKQSVLKCDFLQGAVNHRLRFGGGRGQHLPKAVGMKGGQSPTIIDATAGLGRDAFLLASLGSQVTLIERSDIIHELLAAGMDAARQAGGQHKDIMDRMTLIHGDSIALLPHMQADVVLVDPMHPPRQKSALVKGEMRAIRDIVGVDEDQQLLVETALAMATKRVVLKWPAKAAPLAGLRPASHQIIGKSIRYDVFMTSKEGG